VKGMHDYRFNNACTALELGTGDGTGGGAVGVLVPGSSELNNQRNPRREQLWNA
jgi:hypothetical protein